MRKKDIAAHVAAETGLAKRDAAAAVNAVFGCMSGALLRGETVRVAHFDRRRLILGISNFHQHQILCPI